MCEWLNTVSLLKSEFIKDSIKPKKLITTKLNCMKAESIILLSKILVSFKLMIER